VNSPGNSLADTAAGYGRVANLPPGANGFTTIELKSNHLATALDGHVDCTARPAHVGRTTQVWGATVTHRGSGRTLALFRCTQMVLILRGKAPLPPVEWLGPVATGRRP
jgi:1,4-dihydroxy-2-naphthoyl-CoA hydrolase